jgi:hypothetical protein
VALDSGLQACLMRDRFCTRRRTTWRHQYVAQALRSADVALAAAA